MLDISTVTTDSWNSVGTENVDVGKICLRAFRRRTIRSRRPLGCRAIELGKKNAPKGCVVYTVEYGI